MSKDAISIQSTLTSDTPDATRGARTHTRREMWWAMGLAGGAALAATMPRLAGLSPATDVGFYVRNAAVVVLANFSWSSWVGHVMLHNNCLFERLDRFQTRFIAVYAVWAATVVIAFPPLFGFE